MWSPAGGEGNGDEGKSQGTGRRWVPDTARKGGPWLWMYGEHAELVKAARASNFGPHDIRRTTATRLGSMGISRLVTGKVLNHAQRGGMIEEGHSLPRPAPSSLQRFQGVARLLLRALPDIGAPVLRQR